MPSLDTGTIQVFTYKEGPLSPVAHDLRLSFAQLAADLAGNQLTMRIQADSLQVDGTMRDGRLLTEALSPKDVREILENTEKHVLRWRQNREIRFVGCVVPDPDDDEGARITGTLFLNGRANTLHFEAEWLDGSVCGSFRIVPSRWGIPPFKALLGAIRVQDRVDVVFSVPVPQDLAKAAFKTWTSARQPTSP